MSEEPIGALAIRFLKTTAKGYPCLLTAEMAEVLLELIETIDRGQIPLEESFPHLFEEDDGK